MPSAKNTGRSDSKRSRPATSPEAKESQMISLAIDLAEKQLREGTASAQVITHYLKLGTTKERLEREILQKQKELITAKTEAMESAKLSEKLYAEAIAAMSLYKGESHDEEL